MDLLKCRERWTDIIQHYCLANPTPPASGKNFKPKFIIPKLKDYREADPGKDYWSGWPVNKNRIGKSRIDGNKLKVLALDAGYLDIETLGKIHRDLTEGAKIGCTGNYRNRSRSTNAPSAFEHGHEVSDAIAEWIQEGFAYGPVELDKMPEDCKVSGIMTKVKSSGSVRVILNLSAPEGRSVNEGIDGNEFPAQMSSTKKWLRILHRAGVGCRMVKIDWAAGDHY